MIHESVSKGVNECINSDGTGIFWEYLDIHSEMPEETLGSEKASYWECMGLKLS